MKTSILPVILTTVFFFAIEAKATRCFFKTDIVGIKEIFPIVVRGVVLERKSLYVEYESYLLKIKVIQSVKGNFDKEFLEANEEHLGKNKLTFHTYPVGSSHYFPLGGSKDPKEFRIILPADGCPALPR